MSSSILGEHREYLSDEGRLAGYHQALSAVVRSGDTVLDLGTGTGVLGLLAAQAGAARVYALDATAMLGIARAVVRDNGLLDRITLVKDHSLGAVLPERVDVVVADQLGPFGVEAGVLEAYADARRRHLKPGGTLIPRRLDLGLAPVQADALWPDIAFWDRPALGVDVRAIGPRARNTRYFTVVAPDDVLAAPATVATLDPGTHGNAPIRAQATFTVSRPGTLHGLAGWFSAELAPGVSITNSPLAATRLQRAHLLLPVDAPVPVRPGDVVTAALHLVPPSALVRWTVTIADAYGVQRARSVHSTLDVASLSAEELARTHPDHLPTLGPRGAARRTVMSLMDGRTRLEELEAELLARHPELFDSRAAAAAFVGRVVAREGG
jgi:protein arginine N-methyltransferase 1